MARARRLWLRCSERHAFWAAFGVLAVSSLALIWAYPFPPFADGAAISYSGVVLDSLGKGEPFYSRFYEVRPGVRSHYVFYSIFRLLLHVSPPHVALRGIVSTVVLATPLAMLALFRAIGRSRWLSLSGFGLSFNIILNMGFVPFEIGIPLWLLALFLTEANAADWRWWRAAVLALLLLVSPWVHLLYALLVFPSVAVWVVLTARRVRDALVDATVLVLSGLFVVWIVGVPSDATDHASQIAMGAWPLLDRLKAFPGNFVTWTRDGWDVLSTPLFFGAVGLTLVLSQGVPSGAGPDRSRWRRFASHRLEIVAALLFAAYLALPRDVSFPWVAWAIAARAPTCAAMLLSGVPRLVPSGARQALLLAPVGAFSLYHLCALAPPFVTFGRAAEDGLAIAESIPEGVTVLPLFGAQRSKAPSYGRFIHHADRHVATWPVVLRKGYHPGSFCVAPYHPVGCKKRHPRVNASRPSSYSKRELERYDYVIFYDNSELGASPAKAPPNLQRMPMTKIAQRGRWFLWRVDKTRKRKKHRG